ncbi:nicotinate [Treponema primitia ZAS-2]|uniref:Probable nicotinate-nucleotide adenylyltransferase n=1 Tax=Treponema primitia (strain ATCC BAA-887 / DSM 12427 / ZAS-2) TaxID=545694 RepID=F5YJG9_TREPZ|nr:nicotinate (nicotinamide) nucleotide adenylyltransferase [Treponema primitia]AEF84329.1 nicotinate [Treponema primitia ZAS-2]
MRFAILGGSFNPIHLGHLSLAEAVLSAFGYDRVILVPASTSPFKLSVHGASPRDRLDMLNASIPGDPRFTIDDCEIQREGVSYTIDTVKDIIQRYRCEGKPALILGDDLARDFNKWRSAGEIAEITDIIIAHRLSAEALPFPFPHKQLENEILALSSGDLRDRIRSAGPWGYLVPQGARLIIQDRGLYGFQKKMESGFTWETIAAIENTVRTMISPSRFLHSRNVALLTQDLCLSFGMDGPSGYLAGITHDMCKSFPELEMIRLAKKDGLRISRLEEQKPSLLHGRAAAILLREQFGIHTKDILEAVQLHTTAGAEMGPLAKALYIADKIEVSRGQVSEKLRNYRGFTDLDALFTATLDETVAYLRSRKLDLSRSTQRLLKTMQKRGGF